VLDQSVWSSSWMSAWLSSNFSPFSDMMHTHYSITILFCQWAVILNWRNVFSHKNWIALWTSSWYHISSFIAVANQLVP
jgi:hypothetical protein